VFTDLPLGKERRLDLVAQVRTRVGEEELILVHVEVESRWRKGFEARMHEYYMALRLRHRRPVFPIALVLARSEGGLDRPFHREEVLGDEVAVFRFWRVGLPRLDGSEYVGRPNALAPALAALMSPGGRTRREWRMECVRALARIRANDARRRLLADCVETYLPLAGREKARFERWLASSSNREVRKMRKTYSDQMEEIGERRGEKRGEMRGKREALLSQLRVKFGRLPAEVVRTIAAIDNARRLNALLRRVVTARSLDQMGFSR